MSSGKRYTVGMQIISFYAALLLLGLGCFPQTAYLFRRFSGRGWIFSRAVGLFLAGWVFWLLNSAHLVTFSRRNVLLVCAVLIACNLVLFFFVKAVRDALADLPLRRILLEELMFLAVFVMMLLLLGFRPEAYGTEKFMDYGFLTAIRRSDYMPFSDLWFSGKTINYYYGGQYFSAFLIRLAGVTDGYGYNLMRAFVTAVTFSFPFAVGRELLETHGAASAARGTAAGSAGGSAAGEKNSARKKTYGSFAGGLLCGISVAFCGNGHYVVYGILKPLASRIIGKGDAGYWFPDSTRFIGYVGETADKTIHEFPSYSSVLGDLHAHYLNLVFVLLLLSLLIAWAVARKDRIGAKLLPHHYGWGNLLLIGILLGSFRWTNFWDYPIYLVVTAAVLFFLNWKAEDAPDSGFRRGFLHALLQTAASVALMVLSGRLAALPFTGKFTMISSEIVRSTLHSPLWQFLILWAFPLFVLLCFFVLLLAEFRAARHKEEKLPAESLPARSSSVGGFRCLLSHLTSADLIVLIFGAAAAGLILLPELVYVKDIYESGYPRANTMFKLTYQAFLLFGILTGYAAVRVLRSRPPHHNVSGKRNAGRIRRVVGIVILTGILLTAGYFPRSARDWFLPAGGESVWKGLDASIFLSESYPEDYGAAVFLNETAGDTDVILEADGESYGLAGRLSIATGLSTVLGWHTHEWLWRGDWNAVAERSDDIRTIYTSNDAGEIQRLVEQYGISWICIGSVEREAYPDLNEALLKSLFRTAYSEDGGTCVLYSGE